MSKYHVIYSRKSKYTGKGESIENQIDLCKQKILSKYSYLLDSDIKVFIDEGFTGANTNRPAFLELLNEIKDNKVESITCYRLDRVSRNVSDFCNLINELEKYQVAFISIREDFDTTTPMGKAMMLICSVFAQLERDTIAERIRDNMIELAKTGRWLGGNTPTGFKSTEVKIVNQDGKKKKLFKLEEIKDEKELIILLKDKYKEIKSQTGLETYTIKNNLKTKNGNRFTRWALVNILSNPVYSYADYDAFEYFTNKGAIVIGNKNDYDGKYGIMAYNKTNQITGKGKKNNPISEWIIAIGKHKGFWSGKEYIEIQNLLEQGANKRFRKSLVNNALLSGLLRCSHCNSYMRPKTYNKNSKFSYLCELKDKSRGCKCNHKNLLGNITDKFVIKIVQNINRPNEEFCIFLKKLGINKFKNSESISLELNTLNSEFKKNKKDINILLERIKIVPTNIVPDLANEIQKIKKTNIELEERINLLNSKKNTFIDEDNIKIISDNILNTYYKKFDELDILEKRSLIKLVISSAYSDGENLILNLTGTSESAKMTEFPLGDNCK